MELPQTREAWRERFKDGMPWAAVEAAHEAGIMRQERYLFLFSKLASRTRNHKGPDAQERIDSFRVYWEPKRFPGESE